MSFWMTWGCWKKGSTKGDWRYRHGWILTQIASQHSPLNSHRLQSKYIYIYKLSYMYIYIIHLINFHIPPSDHQGVYKFMHLYLYRTSGLTCAQERTSKDPPKGLATNLVSLPDTKVLPEVVGSQVRGTWCQPTTRYIYIYTCKQGLIYDNLCLLFKHAC